MEGEYSWHQVVETIRGINAQTQVRVEEGEKGESLMSDVLPKVVADGVLIEFGWQPKYSLEAGLRKVMITFAS